MDHKNLHLQQSPTERRVTPAGEPASAAPGDLRSSSLLQSAMRQRETQPKGLLGYTVAQYGKTTETTHIVERQRSPPAREIVSEKLGSLWPSGLRHWFNKKTSPGSNPESCDFFLLIFPQIFFFINSEHQGSYGLVGWAHVFPWE